jgi:hypothetical protein
MTTKQRVRVLMLGVFAGTILVPAYAAAQDAQLQRQIDSLQQQLQVLQKQVSDAKKTAAQANQTAQQAQAAVPAAADGAYAQVPGGKYPTKAWALPAGVKLTWGGFIEAAGLWRSKNEVADIGSDFNNIPYNLTPLNHEHELRFTARQSRLWFQAEGDINPTQIIKAYFEMDFLGAATTANSIESNSYTPRIRQAFLNYDDLANGWHFTAGQAWSLLTQNKNGIKARDENIPLTIDAQYVVGFNWTRNAQFRVVKDVTPGFSFGVSAESPQVRFQTPGSGTPGPAGGITVVSTSNGTQSGLMDTLQGYSIDQIPDFIEKAAFDPGFGHYEAIGLQRFFTDRTFCNTAAAVAAGVCAAGLGSAVNQNTFGWGVGGNALVPALPKYLDLQGSVLYGQGIGRYGSGQLPDVTFGPTGQLTPVTALQTLVGAISHFTPDLDVYVYAGLEQDQAKFGSIGGGNFGLGNPAYLDALCFAEVAANATPAVPTSPVTGALSSTTCSVNVRRLEEITIGFWQNLYKGPMGRLTGGLQFEYVHRDVFPGALSTGGALVAPAVDEVIGMASLRYYFP